jgi:hypothetical protein
MEWLGIKFGGKSLDAVDIHADAPGPKGLSRFKIVQVSLGPIGHGALRNGYLSNAGV